jgi:hypothetical protein
MNRMLLTCLAILAATGSYAAAAPQESVTFTNAASDGERGDPTNTVLNHAFSGSYTVSTVHLSGTLTSVNAGSYSYEAWIEVTPPNGASITFQAFYGDVFTTESAGDVVLRLPQPVAAAGTWTVRCFEDFDDSGTDSLWTTVTLTLDDSPTPTSHFELPGGDAGETLASAQSPAGSGPLEYIVGVLGEDADLYRISICEPTQFSATTTFNTVADTQLFLFSSAGIGVAMNDDTEAGLNYYLQSSLSNAFVNSAGEYYLALAGYNRDPVSSTNALIWLNAPYEAERGPDGPAAASAVDHWTGVGNGGAYTIALSGACFTAPACGSADFNGDGDVGTDADIEAFFACLAGNCCTTCDSADFNQDGDTGTDADIEAFFRVLAGGSC